MPSNELELLMLEKERRSRQDSAQTMGQPQEQAAPGGMISNALNYMKQNPAQTASSFYRPALEIGGSVGGGIIGSAGTPVGTAIGGGLGFAAGKSAADLLDRLTGLKKPIANMGEAIKETGSDLYSGAEAEALGQGTNKALGTMFGPGAKQGLSKAAGKFNRLQGGVREIAGERLFKDPGALFQTGSLAQSGENLGAIREGLGMLKEPTAREVTDTAGSVARKTARDVLEKIDSKTPVTPAELLKGKQALDSLVEKTPFQAKNQRRLLTSASQKLGDKLGEFSGAEREASKDYARKSLRNEFLNVIPRTKTGDVSIARTLFLPTFGHGGELAAILPSILGQAPVLGGLATAGAGTAFKGGQALADNPGLIRGLSAALMARRKQRDQP